MLPKQHTDKYPKWYSPLGLLCLLQTPVTPIPPMWCPMLRLSLFELLNYPSRTWQQPMNKTALPTTTRREERRNDCHLNPLATLPPRPKLSISSPWSPSPGSATTQGPDMAFPRNPNVWLPTNSCQHPSSFPSETASVWQWGEGPELVTLASLLTPIGNEITQRQQQVLQGNWSRDDMIWYS